MSQRLFLGVPVRGPEICQKSSKFVRNSRFFSVLFHFFKIWQLFDKFQPPRLEPPKTIARTNLGFGVFSNAVRGKRARKVRALERGSLGRGQYVFFHTGNLENHGNHEMTLWKKLPYKRLQSPIFRGNHENHGNHEMKSFKSTPDQNKPFLVPHKKLRRDFSFNNKYSKVT